MRDQAICTRYLGATDYQGSRIVASTTIEGRSTAEDKRIRITMPYDHELSALENHRAAVNTLCNRHDLWPGGPPGRWVGAWYGPARYWVWTT